MNVCLQAALWTRIFKHHLDLGHNSEAYEALTQNPDCSMYVRIYIYIIIIISIIIKFAETCSSHSIHTCSCFKVKS